MIAQTDFHDHCVLSVQHVFIRVANEVSAYLCTAGTDGKVALWNISQIISQYLKCCKSQCQHLDEAEENLGPCCTDFITDFPAPDLVIVGHQSGVNSIDIRQVKGRKFLSQISNINFFFELICGISVGNVENRYYCWVLILISVFSSWKHISLTIYIPLAFSFCDKTIMIISWFVLFI